jgi:hypothetical protein
LAASERKRQLRSKVTIDDAFAVALRGSAEHPILRRGTQKDGADGMALLIADDELAKVDAYETSDYQRIAVVLVSGREAFTYVSAKT